MVNFNFDKCARILKLKKPPVEKKVVSGNPAPSRKERCLSDFKTVNISTGDCSFSSYDIINFAPSSSSPVESDYIPYAKFASVSFIWASWVHIAGPVTYPKLGLSASGGNFPPTESDWDTPFISGFVSIPYGSTMGVKFGSDYYLGYTGTIRKLPDTFSSSLSMAGFNTFYDAVAGEIVCQDLGFPSESVGDSTDRVFGVCPSHTGPIFARVNTASPNDYIVDSLDCFSSPFGGGGIGKCSLSFYDSNPTTHYPVICYTDITNSKIKYAMATATTPTVAGDWNTYDAISYTPTSDIHANARILYINSGSPHPIIIWQDYTNGEFKCSVGNSSEPLIEGDWTTHTICSEAEMLYTPSFDAELSSSQIILSYLTLDGKLKVALSSDLIPTSGSDWTVCEIIDDEISYLTAGNTNRTSIFIDDSDNIFISAAMRQGTLGNSDRRNKLKVAYKLA